MTGRRSRRGAALVLPGLLAAGPALSAPAFSCGGFALAGGAELLCSHVDPRAPAQVCTWSWTLLTTANAASVVNGSFLLPPGVSNAVVYQGSGFNAPLSPPVILCQGRRDASKR